ncbi:MAG: hypothetical protein ACI89J_002270 [Hyphomicrobiaceae bacterium]
MIFKNTPTPENHLILLRNRRAAPTILFERPEQSEMVGRGEAMSSSGLRRAIGLAALLAVIVPLVVWAIGSL